MGKYKIARFVGWSLVAAGLVFAIVCLVAIVGTSMVRGNVMSSIIGNSEIYAGLLVGLVSALLGFSFHALFDATEKYIGQESIGG